MATTTEDEGNPFLEGAGRFLRDLPLNILQLPANIVNTVLNRQDFRDRNAAANLQGDLREQLTGEENPFSAGRNFLSQLTLGAVPGSPSTEVEKGQLTPGQQQQFAGMSDLQQRLLQAKSPKDFAELISDGALFEERQPLTAVGAISADRRQFPESIGQDQVALAGARDVNAGNSLVVPGGPGGEGPTITTAPKPFTGKLGPGETVVEDGQIGATSPVPVLAGAGEAPVLEGGGFGPANLGGKVQAIGDQMALLPDGRIMRVAKDTIIPEGSKLITQNPDGTRTVEMNGRKVVLKGGEQLTDASTGKTIAVREPDLMDSLEFSDLEDYTVESVDAFRNSGAFSDLKFDAEKHARKMAEKKASAASGGYKTGLAVRKDYGADVKPEVLLAEKYRSILGSYRGGDPSTLPANLRGDFEAVGIDIDGMESSAVADIAMIFGFMKILDRESTVREGEVAMVKFARKMGVPTDWLRQLSSGEALRPEQRAELLGVLRSAFVTQLTQYGIKRDNWIDIAEAGGYDPNTFVPDLLSDLAPIVNESMRAVDARRRAATVEKNLEEWDKAYTGDPNDEEALREHWRQGGFSVPE